MGPLIEIYISGQVHPASGGVPPHLQPTKIAKPEITIKAGNIVLSSKTAAASLPEGRPPIVTINGVSDYSKAGHHHGLSSRWWSDLHQTDPPRAPEGGNSLSSLLQSQHRGYDPEDSGFQRAMYGSKLPGHARHPVPVRVGARYRDIQTGGGLCCPGRHEPRHRPPPRLVSIHSILKRQAGLAFPDPAGGTTTLISSLRSGLLRKFTVGTRKGVSPFPSHRIVLIQQELSKAQRAAGFPNELGIHPRQPFHLSLLASFESRARERGVSLVRRILKDGALPLGVDEELASAEPHYPSDKKTPDPELEVPWNPDIPKYASHQENVADTIATYHE